MATIPAELRERTGTVPEPEYREFRVLDPLTAAAIVAEREASGADRYDEVWEGVYVMSPLADIEHQDLATALSSVLFYAVDRAGLGRVFNGVNVSDREKGWKRNYRVPDVAVYLRGNPARHCGTYWCGGPDFAVEVISPEERPREKFPFYASTGTREVLLMDRDPWTLELHRLRDGALVLIGASTPERPDVLASEVLPLTFRLIPGEDRPRIEVQHTDGIQRWVI